MNSSAPRSSRRRWPVRRQALVFWAVALLVLSPVYRYIGVRLVSESALPLAAAVLAWSLLALHMAMVPASFVTSRLTRPSKAVDVFHWATYLGMGFLALVLPMLAVRDLAEVAWRVLADPVAHARVASAAISGDASALVATRLGNLAIIVVSLVATTSGVTAARRVARVKRVTVPIAGLPASLAGYRIVQITDVHVGPTIKGDYVRRIVDEVNALDPHLVVLTGDLVDGSVANLREHTRPLADVAARDGRFYVTGNHEYYSGAEAWVREVARLGFTPLVNEHRLLEIEGGARVLVAGVTDVHAGRAVRGHRCDPEAALRDAPPADVTVFLAHQPNTARHAARLGAHLHVSGHTHGGQFFPWHLPVRLSTPYVAGLYRVGAMWLYVSRGTGYWGPPMRLGAPSEITLLELARAD